MPSTIFSPSIPSRPVYAALIPQGASPAIMVVDEPGATALSDLAAADPSVMDQAHLVAVGLSPQATARLTALAPRGFHPAPDLQTAAPLLAQLLGQARMGTQMYLAGSEGLMGHAAAAAMAHGLPAEAIQMEHRGPVTRRMQCVHCKGITEDVATDPFTCAHCGLTLFVRDHFSRRLGVFQGVCVDAETPGDLPQTQEIRP